MSDDPKKSASKKQAPEKAVSPESSLAAGATKPRKQSFASRNKARVKAIAKAATATKARNKAAAAAASGTSPAPASRPKRRRKSPPPPPQKNKSQEAVKKSSGRSQDKSGPKAAEFPEKLEFLFRPMRYKVAYGGRGSSKSWGFARALIIMATQRKLRVLCTREVQRSIKDSVHKLISDQVRMLGAGSVFEITDRTIRCTLTGSEFLFSGLSTHTVESIKSFEGVDIAWVEEAQVVQKRSWDILIPTIRAPNSEIWVTFNPNLETDDTYQRFVAPASIDGLAVEVNWRDNPWFPEVLERERVRCFESSPVDYRNIWEGKCRPAVEGAIYHDEISVAIDQGRVCNVPYDPMLKVHVVIDIGWNDCTAIALVQRHTSEIRIIEYIEDSHKTWDYYSAILRERRYNWGRVWLPHDGFSGSVKTGLSDADIWKKLGWDVPRREEITELGVESGIKMTRMNFSRLYFDTKKTERLIQCCKRYRRRVNNQTNESSGPLHDEWSHGADCLRYVCVNAESMRNEARRVVRREVASYAPLDSIIGI